MTVDQLPETRRAIVATLKVGGASTIAQLAERLSISGEAVRQQLLQLQREGWVEAIHPRENGAPKAGRPAASYRLTSAGDHLFPKGYDGLAVALLDAVSGALGDAALDSVLSRITEELVHEWEPRMQGLNLEQRIEMLKALYIADDPFIHSERANSDFKIIERNCPYLNVAQRRPRVCSVTVSMLGRLLGVEVEREERFQKGDGRCVFRVHPDRPIPSDAPIYRPEKV